MQVIIADPPILELYPEPQPVGVPPFLEHVLAGLRERKPILYCWGDKLYNPRGGMIPPELMVHEQVHSDQQLRPDTISVERWWLAYIDNPQFRLSEEIPAHRAEYTCLKGITRDRNALHQGLHRIALRLSSPLYGSMIDYEHAKHAVAGDQVTPGYRDDPELQVQRQRFRPTS